MKYKDETRNDQDNLNYIITLERFFNAFLN